MRHFLLGLGLVFFAVWAHAQPSDSTDPRETDKNLAKSEDETTLQQNLPGQGGFRNDSELGFVSSEGNSNSQSTNLQQKNSYSWSGNNLVGTYNFLRSESGGNESTRRWTASLLFERNWTSAFGYYVYQGYQADPYGGYNLRSNSELGLRYDHLHSDKGEWFTYAGFRYTLEQRVDSPHDISTYGHLYTQWNHQWSPTLSSQIWGEYLPNFRHNREYQLNGEASMFVMLNSILSLKTAYLIMYNNQPPPRATHQRDTLLTTSLVAKF